MMNLKGKQPTDPNEQLVARPVSDERYYDGRRVRLPARFTEGQEVFVVYLSVWKNLLPDRYLQAPWVECVAPPGDDGEIEMTAALNAS